MCICKRVGFSYLLNWIKSRMQWIFCIFELKIESERKREEIMVLAVVYVVACINSYRVGRILWHSLIELSISTVRVSLRKMKKL